jgi:hypothetical protein
MKITYDHNLKIAGLGLVPWNRLGPEQWFQPYAIASLYKWDLAKSRHVPGLFALQDEVSPMPRLSKLNTQALLKAKEFQQLLADHLTGYDLFTYKPVKIPKALRAWKFIMSDVGLAKRLENKAEFRELFKRDVAFPSYAIFPKHQLLKDRKTFGQVMDGGGGKVIQDAELSGGKGTFIVSNFSEYCQAIDRLEASSADRVVVSDVVKPAKERTIQCVVTKHGVFIGPLHRQIVAHPLLANTKSRGDKFCGAQILAADQGTPLHREATAIATLIGNKLQQMGYKGIFGIDFLLAPDGQLLVIEVNPRITGVTPLLTALKEANGIPFYLLHLLELGSYDYDIIDKSYEFEKTGALLVLHSLEDHPIVLEAMPPSGTYRWDETGLVLIDHGVDLSGLKKGEFIIQDYAPNGLTIRPGDRLVTLLFPDQILDENSDKLYNDSVSLIETIRSNIITKPVQL